MADLYCDICGKGPVRAQILVEGAKMLACGSCMRSGKVLFRFEEGSPASPPPSVSVMEAGEEIIEGYGRRISGARDRLKLPLSVVAERVREKESYLNAVEHERLMPTLEVARKLEKELGIKLIEKVQATAGGASTSPRSFSEPTLGDMVDPKKKK
ncbi:MAG: multiprotein-bridging factor 1 family protein [Candidatus Micrarchaeota archaeon]